MGMLEKVRYDSRGGVEDLVLEKEMKRGETFLHLAQAFDLAIVNTFYSKRRENLLTYKNGGKDTVTRMEEKLRLLTTSW